MTDDLTARCLAEVERAMAQQHDAGCPAAYSAWAPPGKCTCLAARLARMMAAGMDELVGWAPMSQPGKDHAVDRALRAIAHAREAP